MSTSVCLETLSSEELVTALQAGLRRSPDADLRVERLVRRPFDAATSSVMEALDVRLSDGTLLELLAKNVGPGGMLGSAAEVKPPFLHDPTREVAIYRSLLQTELGTADYVGAIEDPVFGRYVLLLERVRGSELRDVGSLAAWSKAARWLGKFQSWVRSRARPALPLLLYDRAYFARWPVRALAILDGNSADRVRLHLLRELARAFDRTVDVLLSMPTSIVHGDYSPSNVLVAGDGDSLRICPVDWEVAGVGPALYDLAALMSGDWDLGEREAMVTAYLDSVKPTPAWPPSIEEATTLLDHCEFALAMQWLGWAPSWVPPPRQNRDWLDVARNAFERTKQ